VPYLGAPAPTRRGARRATIVLNGGSGSGKSGIARCLQAVLPDPCTVLLRRADRLWPPSFRDLLVEPTRAAPEVQNGRGPEFM